MAQAAPKLQNSPFVQGEGVQTVCHQGCIWWPGTLKSVSGCTISLFEYRNTILHGCMMLYGLCGFKRQNFAFFDQKSEICDFSTTKNNTWVRRSAEKFSAWTTNINYFLQKNFDDHTMTRKFFLTTSRGGEINGPISPPPWKSKGCPKKKTQNSVQGRDFWKINYFFFLKKTPPKSNLPL